MAVYPAEVMIVFDTVFDSDVPPAEQLAGQFATLSECDGYVVLAVDPETGEADAHGPYDGLGATTRAQELRTEFDRSELGDVLVRVVRLHRPRPGGEEYGE